MNTSNGVIRLLWVALLLALSVGCQAAKEADGGYGTIALPLSGTGTSGAAYRLTSATFDIAGPDTLSVSSAPSEVTLEVDVTPGAYQVSLQGGWTVQMLQSGSWVDVQAALISSPTVAVDVAQGVASQALFRFGVGDEFITFGKGRLSIGAEFDDNVTPPLTLAAVDRGWWNSPGVHSSGNQNTVTGNVSNNIYNSYFTFDLGGVADTIAVATLRLELESYASMDPSALVSVWDVTTSAAALDTDASATPAGQAINQDLQSGATYGSFAVTAGTVGTVVSIPLSPSAVADLNAGPSTFSVGVHLEGGPSLDEYVRFSAASETRTNELVLDFAP